jgi:hypothetical protein
VFLKEVVKHTIPKIQKNYKTVKNRASVIGEIGRTMTFGYGKTRTRGYQQFRWNRLKPELLEALINIGRQVVPEGFFFNAITLNHNVLAKKHVDNLNFGDSVIIGIGNYEGGFLNVYDSDGIAYNSYNIQDAPLMFNGSILPHETQPFTGERYTIIYYRQKYTQPIDQYEGDTVGVGVGGKSVKKIM